MKDGLLAVEDLAVRYRLPGGLLRRGPRALQAVDGVSFTLAPGETLGVVGETGCGKSSLGKTVLQLVPASAGRVLWRGQDLCRLRAAELRPLRREMQIVFQDPLSSLNPRMTVAEIVAEPLLIHEPALSAREREQRALAMLEHVGLRTDMARRYPREFSGGQCQRISIARAMILAPKLVVCDEPVSALDVSIQAQICNLLRQLQRETGIAMLFISHDLSIVRYMATRVMVMYLGRVMEIAPREVFFTEPRHPYSQALLRSVPVPDPKKRISDYLQAIEGDLPSPLTPPSGCVFRTRCPKATPLCVSRRPPLIADGEGRLLACHHPD